MKPAPRAGTRSAHALAADCIAADALLVAFAVLVTLILDVVPGWSAPLRAWLAISMWAFTALSLHAISHAWRAMRRRRWRRAGVATALACGLALAAVVMFLLAARLPGGTVHDFDDATVPSTKEPR